MISNGTYTAERIPDWRAEFKRLEGAYAPSTMKSYYSDLSDFEKWCLTQGRDPFPAIPSTVCAYLEDIAQRLTVATVRRRMYAISRSHKLLRLDDPTRDEDVHLTIRKIMRSKLSRPQQAKGLTYDYLLKFLEVQPDTPWGLRNRALISLGYDILARRSELAALMTNDIEERPDGTLRLIIRRSKNDPFGMGRLAFTSKRTRNLVAEWLEWRGPYIEPLFCCIYQNRAVNRAISGDKVKAIIKQSARQCDIDQSEAEAFSAHSMRVGAAQDLLRNGHDTAAIMRAGGWKSIDVLARYLEFAEHNVWACSPAVAKVQL